MGKAFYLDFVRQIIYQTLLEEKIKNPTKYIGGKNEVSLLSFYEQLVQQDDVDRFTEIYKDLIDQQNRTGLIANGVIVSPENPTITNLNQCTIVPLSFTATFRCTLEDRDLVLESLNHAIELLKGRKRDIAEFDNGKLFQVGTFGNNVNGMPLLHSGDFLGVKDIGQSLYYFLTGKLLELEEKMIDIDLENNDYLYYEENNQLKVGIYYHKHYDNVLTDFVSRSVSYNSETKRFYIIEERTSRSEFRNLPIFREAECSCYIDGTGRTGYGNINDEGLTNEGLWTFTITWVFSNVETEPSAYSISSETIVVDEYDFINVEETNEYPDIIFPPEHESFAKYKVSLSFDALRCDEPRTLNGNEYCQISLGGSATVTNARIRFGNDILKVGITKLKIKGSPDIEIYNALDPTWYWLEPLEVPASNNANTKPIQLIANAFKTNSHTDSLNINLQYTFVIDTEIALIKQFYDYARYGEQAVIESGAIVVDGITPNMIFGIVEFYNTWGNYEIKEIPTKVVESVDIDNSESDTLTITIPFQVQGEY